MTNFTRHPASFKDPSGFIFQASGTIYRQVNQYYAADYNHLISSGLYQQLTKAGLLIPHQELAENLTGSPDWYRTLIPEPVPAISYPYEWCFEQLRDAALLTLKVLRAAVAHGMILKDATPYNVQFHHGKPVFIDTLSFEKYDSAKPWVAYRQFCQCFLFPLYLEHYLKADIQKTLSSYLEGIPVDITSKLLPLKSNLSLGVWLHVYLQNTVHSSSGPGNRSSRFSRKKLLDMVRHLESILQRFPAEKNIKTTWNSYYEDTILGKEYLHAKEALFRQFCTGITYNTVLDLGANEGYFSKIIAHQAKQVIATDYDGQCINKLYLHVKKTGIPNLLPLVLDVTNPSPAIGFNNQERAAFHDRLQPDLVLALALVHHLVIGKNVPLEVIAGYMHHIAPQLIIEFVSKEDEKVKQMLRSRVDVFDNYSEAAFEAAFAPYFAITQKSAVPHSSRTLYYMKRKQPL